MTYNNNTYRWLLLQENCPIVSELTERTTERFGAHAMQEQVADRWELGTYCCRLIPVDVSQILSAPLESEHARYSPQGENSAIELAPSLAIFASCTPRGLFD